MASAARTRVALLLIAISVTAAGPLVGRASAQFIPVSWHIHASSTAASGATHTPPDVSLGAVYGSNSVNSSVTAPNGAHAQFVVTGLLQPTEIAMGFGGSVSITAQGQTPTGGGNGDIVFSLPTAVTVDLDNPFSSQGSSYAGGSARLTNSTGSTIFSRSYLGTYPQHTLFVLPADTYTFHVNGGVGLAAGTSGGGNVFLDMTIVPEPSSALTAVVCGIGLMRRARRTARAHCANCAHCAR